MMSNQTAAAAQSGPVIASIGCASAASAEEIVALVQSCLAEMALPAEALAGLVSHVRRAHLTALSRAAQRLAVPLRFLDDSDLAAQSPSLCEAMAGQVGTIGLSKRKSRYATCALAYLPAGSSSAEMASSTVSTS